MTAGRLPSRWLFEHRWHARQEHDERDPEQRHAAERHAFEAAQAKRAGKSPAQIREIYVAEVHARGLTVPSDRMLDAIARHRDKITASYAVRLLAELGRRHQETALGL